MDTANCALKIGSAESTAEIATYVKAAESTGTLPVLKDFCATVLADERNTGRGKANWFLFIAELMKRIGDFHATSYYERATQADPNEAGHRLFYGDYLRNFRGPEEPLFPQAEGQYKLGEQTLTRVRKLGLLTTWDDIVASRIARGLIALHQADGVPLAFRENGIPTLFFASTFRFAQAGADLDRTSDVRDYTSAAAFAQSAARNNAPLNRDELRSLVEWRLR